MEKVCLAAVIDRDIICWSKRKYSHKLSFRALILRRSSARGWNNCCLTVSRLKEHYVLVNLSCIWLLANGNDNIVSSYLLFFQWRVELRQESLVSKALAYACCYVMWPMLNNSFKSIIIGRFKSLLNASHQQFLCNMTPCVQDEVQTLKIDLKTELLRLVYKVWPWGHLQTFTFR